MVAIIKFVEILFLLGAAYFSNSIFKFNRLNKAWLVLTISLLLMALNNIALIFLGSDYTENLEILNESFLPLLIAISLFWGLWSMKKSFEDFDVIDKESDKLLKSKKSN